MKFHAEKPDVYTVTVSDSLKVPIATRPIEIRDVNVEFQDTARNMETLRQWASVSDGLAFKVEDCPAAADLVATAFLVAAFLVAAAFVAAAFVAAGRPVDFAVDRVVVDFAVDFAAPTVARRVPADVLREPVALFAAARFAADPVVAFFATAMVVPPKSETDSVFRRLLPFLRGCS